MRNRTNRPLTTNMRAAELQLAEAKRDIDNMLRQLEQAGDRKAVQKRAPAKFQKVPFEGGAESLIKDIESTSAKDLGRVLGRNVGMKQVLTRSYLKMSDVVGDDLDSYAAVAASVLVTMIYNITQYGFTEQQLKDFIKGVESAFVADFTKNASIESAIDAALAVDRTYTDVNSNPQTEKLLDAITATGLTGAALKANVLYPYNGAYLRYMSSLVEDDVVQEADVADFVFKNKNYLYTALSNRSQYPDDVPTPNLISGLPKAADLNNWFKRHSEYSLYSTYETIKETMGGKTARTSFIKSDVEAIVEAIKVTLEDFRRGVRVSGIGTSDTLAEVDDFNSLIKDCLTGSMDRDKAACLVNILDANKNTTVTFNSLDSINYHVIDEPAICDIIDQAIQQHTGLVAAAAAGGSGTTKVIAHGTLGEAEEALNRLVQLIHDLAAMVIGQSGYKKMLSELESRITAPSAPTNEFTALANDTLDQALNIVCGDFMNAGFAYDSNLATNVGDALNGLLQGYVKQDILSVVNNRGSLKVEYHSGVTPEFKDEIVDDLSVGGSLSIYSYSEGDIYAGLAQTEQAIDEIYELDLARSVSDSVVLQIINAGETIQQHIDSIIPMAERTPSLRIRTNPANEATLTQKLAYGGGSFVGTGLVTAIAKRYTKDKSDTVKKVAEHLPSALAVGAGAYYAFGKDNKDVGIPVMAGAAGSWGLNLWAKHADKNGGLYKYFLKYASFDFVVGETASVPAPAPAAETAPAPVAETAPAADNAPANGGTGRYVRTGIPEQKLSPMAQLYSATAGVPSRRKAMGRILHTNEDLDKAVAEENAPLRTQMPILDKNPMGRYFSTGTPIEHMSVDHEAEKQDESAPLRTQPPVLDRNPMGRYVKSQMPQRRVDHSEDMMEMVEHLDQAEPLTSVELKEEGLGRYLSETVVRATNSSAVKFAEAGVADILKPSNKDNNVVLIRVNDLGIPVQPEMNPSVPVDIGYGPKPIEPSTPAEVRPSGLFNRGAFASGFPKA